MDNKTVFNPPKRVSRVAITKSKLDSLAQHINAKAGTSGKKTLSQLETTVDSITRPNETVTYSQINAVASEYLNNVTYVPSDYSASQIDTYANTTTDYRKDQPAPVSITTGAGVMTVTDQNGNSQIKTVNSGAQLIYNIAPQSGGASYAVQSVSGGALTSCGRIIPTGTLRMIKSQGVLNVRDLGGWSCDGGTVKYGIMFRGAEVYGKATNEDKDMFRNLLRIGAEVNLRYESEVINKSESGFGAYCDYHWIRGNFNYSGIADDAKTGAAKQLFSTIMQCVIDNKPVYFHCAMGADRTGTAAFVLEAILGMSQSDIDKDYELSSFYTVLEKGTTLPRTNNSYKGLVQYFTSMPGATLRDKVTGWLVKLGIPLDTINKFRAAAINGTPTALSYATETYSITSSLTNVKTDNTAATATQYQPYSAKITAGLPQGLVIKNVNIKMGGKDITDTAWRGTKTVRKYFVNRTLNHCTAENGNKLVTEGESYVNKITAADGYTLSGGTVSIKMGGVQVSGTYYKDGVIAIPAVTGDIEISITGVSSAVLYTNQIPISTDSSGEIYNGKGFKENTELSDTGTDVTAAGSGISATGFIPIPEPASDALGGVVLRFSNTALALDADTRIVYYDSSKAKLGVHYGSVHVVTDKTQAAVGKNYAELDNNDCIKLFDISKVCWYYKNHASTNSAAYIRICGSGIGEESIATINEEIV